jgi:DNA-binding response OmpR family regulator
MRRDDTLDLRSVVLLVDDEPTHHEVVRTTCASGGLTSLVAADATTAIQFTEETQPVAIICSLRLSPNVLLALIGELRRRAARAMIVAITDGRTAALEAGVDTILERPVDESLIVGLIEACIPAWSAAAAAAAAATRKRVLVIEHEPTTAVTIRNWLLASYEVVVVTSGRRGLDEISLHGAPDAVVAELRLPDIDAPELFAALDAQAPGLSERAIFLSSGFIADRAQAFLARIPGRWIRKPFAMAPLLRMLSSVIRDNEHD